MPQLTTFPDDEPGTILRMDVERAIDDVQRKKHLHMYQLLHMIELYGLTEVSLWVRNVEKDLNSLRLAPGTAWDPRR